MKDVSFIVTVHDVPDHLVDLIRAYIGMNLDVMTNEMIAGIDENQIDVDGGIKSSELSDDDWEAIANLGTDVSETLESAS